MESRSADAPLVVIIGQTASGKSALAMDLAKLFNGEIVAADSRTVYKGMDVGTTKPSAEDRRLVSHHLIDVSTPDEVFTVAQFKTMADRLITDIASRGKLPMLVGGSGLYLDAVLYDYRFKGVHNVLERQRLQGLSVLELQRILAERGIDLPRNDKNPRHLVGTILNDGVVKQEHKLRPNTLVLGLDVERGLLRERVKARTQGMLDDGLEKEVRKLVEEYGWTGRLPDSIGYQDFRDYLDGKASIESVRESIITRTMQYAKRQKTWFKRNPDVIWISNRAEAVDLVTTFLNK